MSPQEQELLLSSLESFLDENVITEILECVRGGKEATVFKCRAGPSLGGGFVAAKIYRPDSRRSFRNNAQYQHGRVILNKRVARALAAKTDFGRECAQYLWIAAEYETQQLLYEAGAQVPRPIAFRDSCILMQWIGDDSPAPQLRHAELSASEARVAREHILCDIERMLDRHRIHGDLSPFNILWWAGRPWVIDFPQAVDARMNGNSYALLCRDAENVFRFFARHGMDGDPWKFATRLWDRYVLGELGKEG
jgi:RIO kinase 1